MSTRTICGQPWTATSGPRARSAADSPEPGPEPPERGRPPPSTTAPRPSAHGPRPTRSRSRRAAASRRASSSGSARPATDTQPGDRTGQSCLVLSSVHPPREPPTRRGFRTDPPADAPIRDSWLTRPAAGGRLWQQRAGGAPNRPSGVPERPALSGGRRNTFRAGGVGVVAEWRRVGDERQQRFWELVTSGASSSQACEAVGVNRRQGYRWRRDSGGQPPPAPRVVSARYLSLEERLQIADLHLAGASRRAIAAQLGRAPSTISRELRRNGPVAGRAGRARYAPYAAHKRAGLRARRPKPFKLDDARLALAVQDKLCLKWSPAQISAHLAGEHGDKAAMRVSHETIYQALFVQGRGQLRTELHRHLRTGRAWRRPHGFSGATTAKISGMVSISERPAEAADRAVPGHWEGDLILGQHCRSAIGTLVERQTRFCLLVHLPYGHGAETVRDRLVAAITTLPA